MKATIVGLFIIGSAVLVVYAAYVGWWGLMLDSKINPVLVASVAVNLSIAIFLQFFLASRISDRRAEKDLLIQNVNDAIASLKSCRDTLTACHDGKKLSADNISSIKSSLRRLANTLEVLQSAMEVSHCKKLHRETADLFKFYFDLKQAATGGDFPSKAYKRELISEQEQTCRLFYKRMQSLLFDINKYS